MIAHDEAAVRRRADGSIDTEFYVRRAVRLRSSALRQRPFIQAFAALVGFVSRGRAGARFSLGRRPAG